VYRSQSLNLSRPISGNGTVFMLKHETAQEHIGRSVELVTFLRFK
jgi:hypothetical protein